MRFRILGRLLSLCGMALIGVSLSWVMIEPGFGPILTLLGAVGSLAEGYRQRQKHHMKGVSLRELVQIVAVMGIGGSVLWMILSPNFEALTALLGSLIMFPSSFATSDEPLSQDMLRELFQQGRRQRQAMLQAVRQRWINDALANTLFQNNYIAVPMFYNHSTICVDEQEPTSVVSAFDAAQGRLLILGEPGAGKSVQSYILIRDLLARADADEDCPIPMLYPLSSWAQKRQPLKQWLTEEVPPVYGISRLVFRTWLEGSHFQLILDGLDEVPAAYRVESIKAINAFIAEYPTAEIVVTSRTQEYRDAQTELALNGTATLYALTPTLINQYLDQGAGRLDSVRVLLADDASLWDFAAYPLNLSLMARTFEGLEVAHLPQFESIIARRRYLFGQYVNQMFSHHQQRSGKTVYDSQKTLKALGWLAQKMKQHNQSLLLVESLQPSWLPNWFERAVHTITSITMMGCVGNLAGIILSSGFLLSILVLMIVYLANYFQVDGTTLVERLQDGVASIDSNELLIVGLGLVVIGMMGGTGGSVLGAIVFGLTKQIHFVEALRFDVVRALVSFFKGAVVGVIASIGTALLSYLFLQTPAQNLSVETLIPAALVILGTLVFIVIGLMPALILGAILFGFERILRWDWMEMRKGAAIAILLGLFSGWLYLWTDQTITGAMLSVVFTTFAGAGLGFFIGGLVSKSVIARTHPNQGYRSSLRNGVLMAGLFAVLIGVVTWIGFYAGLQGSEFVEQAPPEVVFAQIMLSATLSTSFSILIACLAGLGYGGAAVIRHMVLRMLLRMAGRTPPGLVNFLNYTSELIFLRRVGGAYEFFHPLLRDYFAESYT